MDRKQRERKKQAKRKVAARPRSGLGEAKGNDGPGCGSSSNQQKWLENKRYNRWESQFDHCYFTEYGSAPQEEHLTQGMIKCRLLHGKDYSLVIPDQLYLTHKGLKWIQPLAFLANQINKFSEEHIQCVLHVDISCRQHVRVEFCSRDLKMNLLDGSQFYECNFFGPLNLHDYATGEAELNPVGLPYVRLYHHTTADSRLKILDSRHLRTGKYNIQGASKVLRNVAYAYFTPLDGIRNDNDLKQIAMAQGGALELRRDGFAPPPVLEPNFRTTFKDDILTLQVYQCDPAKREACVEVWVDASVLAPQHVYRHDEGLAAFYEFPNPFIQRVGTLIDQHVAFDSEHRIHRQAGLKSFEYIVVGDCTELAGLAAPYDEEDTTHIMKLEKMEDGQSLLEFWFEHGNQDLYSEKHVEMQTFEVPGSGHDGDP